MNRQSKQKTARGERSRTVYVGMSGGVDSSVAALLLKQRGFNVVGVFMRPWSPESEPLRQAQGKDWCLWQQDREDAMRSAAAIGIPFLTWDFSKEYKKSVADYMIREYKAGRTPNPDVMCNKEIKFGLFLKKALAAGADYIATGHYVRIKRITNYDRDSRLRTGTLSEKLRIKTKSPIRNPQSVIYQLLQAKDQNKDQSYFLWTLTQSQLKHCLFPVGEYLKPEVRKLAKKFKLPNHAKKDSQGVCFIGPLDMKDFLSSYIKVKKGKILLYNAHSTRFARSGRVLGEHDGIYYYTLGQRHGLNITNGGGPYYVVKKDIKKNIIYVGTDAQAVAKEAGLEGFNWLNRPKLPARLDVKVRYRTKSVSALLNREGILKFEKPERAVTSGQSAVFYKGQELIGGGVIV